MYTPRIHSKINLTCRYPNKYNYPFVDLLELPELAEYVITIVGRNLVILTKRPIEKCPWSLLARNICS